MEVVGRGQKLWVTMVLLVRMLVKVVLVRIMVVVAKMAVEGVVKRVVTVIEKWLRSC